MSFFSVVMGCCCEDNVQNKIPLLRGFQELYVDFTYVYTYAPEVKTIKRKVPWNFWLQSLAEKIALAEKPMNK